MNVSVSTDIAVRGKPVPDKIKVWDPFVRLFHWSLVSSVLVALITTLVLPPTWVKLHIIAGTAALVLVAARVVWGFFGPGSARFASFVHGPRDVLRYVGEIRANRAPHHVGHNPLGGFMIAALLATVALLGVTGTVVLGGALKSGPLAFMTSFAVGQAFRQIHGLIAYGLIGLVLGHVAGVVVESLRTRENLVRTMIDGRKRMRPLAIGCGIYHPRPLLTALIVAALVGGGGAAAMALSNRPALGVPVAPLDPLYAKECGDCHAPFHPSLARAATWTAIMNNLGDHFGEDASLEPAKVAKIRRYLVANAAESVDTKPAHVLSRTNPAEPLSITATRFWQRAHRRIADAVFASKAVHSRSNCNACHQDAETGLFNPEAIKIPTEVKP
jgi:cytochrome b